ncbi:phage gp6-like head-tail connector protein [Actinoplanes lobatus]|uniref:Phage gp6-like head-tail connector protein n=1 Tax=Actinoplanes lobatus TaxID=113568 RepID=A0A7W7HRU5_9ACTN|nr:phage gp6-like head-tail connector protein [Actinoplanes lobatus]MBB4755302.1 hypothetical protein [Actinoplanes lobatus]GIE46202.1 hypothetical protein Alo02nite_91000 [Actinoplanes lobatus]
MANEYATLTELKAARKIPLSDTADDAALTRALTRASRAIDDRTGRRFWRDGAATARTGALRGRIVRDDGDGELLLVDDIASIAGLVVELGDGTTWTTVADFFTEPDNALVDGRAITGLRRDRGLWRTSRRWRITAVWGWPEVPEPIAEACVLLANRRFMRRESPEGVSGWSNEGPVRVSRFDPDIEDLVAPYVLSGFA